MLSGGLRFAPTTGYYLSTLRVENREQSELTEFRNSVCIANRPQQRP
jgi:hypothetical protein